MKNKTCILYCNCGAGIISEEKQKKLKHNFEEIQADVYELHDLCACSISEKDFLNDIGKTYENKFVVACYPRAVKNLLKQNDIDFGEFEILNFRVTSAEQIKNKIISDFQLSLGISNYQVKKSELKVPAWFPIIDKSLCTLCGQCSRFCLFGVYSYNKKSLNVVNPLACKNNCPACGRTCPASAIIFPRLPENSVLSGAEPNKEKVEKPDGNGSLFTLLNERNSARKNIFRQGFVKLAEEERNKALEELKKGFTKKE
jgi:heterodisulfide reductase subunit A-like polyferredoxin